MNLDKLGITHVLAAKYKLLNSGDELGWKSLQSQKEGCALYKVGHIEAMFLKNVNPDSWKVKEISYRCGIGVPRNACDQHGCGYS